MVDDFLLDAAQMAAGRNWVRFADAWECWGRWDGDPSCGPRWGDRAYTCRDFVGQPPGEAFGDLVLVPDYNERQAVFRDLPTRPRHLLVGAGFTMGSQLAGASDRELLALPGMGRTSLARIRALYPLEVRTCPHCGGDLTDPDG